MKLNNIVYSFSEFASAMAKLHDEKHFDYSYPFCSRVQFLKYRICVHLSIRILSSSFYSPFLIDALIITRAMQFVNTYFVTNS